MHRIMGKSGFVVVLVIVVVTTAGSSSINSIFTTRSIVPSTLGGLSSNLVKSIDTGAQMAVEHCQKVFQWDRWNCPQSTFTKKYRHAATREQAFAQAIVAAGIVHAITRNCSSGAIKGCGCASEREDAAPLLVSGRDIDPSKLDETIIEGQRVDWTWGGCSDNVEFGEVIARKYLEEAVQNDGPLPLAHVHNNIVGREIVRKLMVKRCRCHGVSGSCTVQTCWKQAAPFEAIAAALKQKYEGALRIDAAWDMSNFAVKSAPRRLPDVPTSGLVFVEASADYCQANATAGWKGTRGRICSRQKGSEVGLSEKRSCRNICRSCGHRVRRTTRTVTRRCNCTFRWCCEVICEVCTNTVEEFYCD